MSESSTTSCQPKPIVSVVITTRNRREEVTHCIHSCLTQSEPCEVIVFDDASTDGTSDWIRSEFPSIRLITRDRPYDSCINRNEGFRIAQGEFVISLDDDSFFLTSETAQAVVKAFQEFSEAAILALAYVEPLDSGARCMPTIPEHGASMRGYVACAAAFRMSSIRKVQGYRDILIHQGEERDLAIRILEQGERILFVRTPEIVHLYSPKRDYFRMNYFGFRNTILFSWMRMPFPECIVHAISSTFKLFFHRFTWSTLGARIHALSAGWWGAVRYRKERAPVSRTTMLKYYSLPSHGPCPLPPDKRQNYRDVLQAFQPATPGLGTHVQ